MTLSLDNNEEEDEFLKHFDADGNFIEKTQIQTESEEEQIDVIYTLKKNKD